MKILWRKSGKNTSHPAIWGKPHLNPGPQFRTCVQTGQDPGHCSRCQRYDIFCWPFFTRLTLNCLLCLFSNYNCRWDKRSTVILFRQGCSKVWKSGVASSNTVLWHCFLICQHLGGVSPPPSAKAIPVCHHGKRQSTIAKKHRFIFFNSRWSCFNVQEQVEKK